MSADFKRDLKYTLLLIVISLCGFHLLTSVAEAGSWNRFLHYNGTDSTAQWVRSLMQEDEGC